MPFREVTIPDPFIGRRDPMAVFERLLFSHEHWHNPFVVRGPSGVGKTSFVAYSMKRLSRMSALWPDVRSPESIEEVIREIDDRLHKRRRPAGAVAVVLDDVDNLSNRELNSLVRGILNFKIVRAAIITTTGEVDFERVPTVTLAPLPDDESRRAFPRTREGRA